MNARTSRPPSLAFAVVTIAALAGCAEIARVPEAPPAPAPETPAVSAPTGPRTAAPATRLRGNVSLYGPGFEGKKTASGETFDPQAMTMAHRTLPFGTKVRVTNLENRRSVEVTVNDRGPYVEGRIADLSVGAARRLDMIDDGVVEALIEILERPSRD